MSCIEVCAAVVLRGDRLLLATRRPGSHLEGKWEFPGGKISAGEDASACISRELREELGLAVKVQQELFRLEFDYPEKTIGLHFMLCLAEDGVKAIPQEGQKCGWFLAEQARALDLAQADQQAMELMLAKAKGEEQNVIAQPLPEKLQAYWEQIIKRRAERLPAWLHIPFSGAKGGMVVKDLIHTGGLHTVCESANCPNKCDCWKRKTATFMILGGTCTRFCRFCSVNHGIPEPVDPDEAGKIAQSVKELGLKYAVITCVTRDDLPDGGSQAMADVVGAILDTCPGTRVEVLCSDYQGDMSCVDKVLAAGPAVFGHNLETVERLTPAVRNKADYRRSLAVLKHASQCKAMYGCIPKSGIMLGLGETEDEIRQALWDLREAGVEIVTLGQYLRPTRKNWPVDRYVTPEEFARWQKVAEGEFGFTRAVSGPFVRSSYMAEEAVSKSLGHPRL